ISNKVTTAFHPPRSVGGNLVFVLFLEVNPGESAGGGRQQEQQARGKTDLEVPIHGLVGRHEPVQPRRVVASPQVRLQLRCHDSVLPQVANSLVISDFHHYRWLTKRWIQILEGFFRKAYLLPFLRFTAEDITIPR